MVLAIPKAGFLNSPKWWGALVSLVIVVTAVILLWRTAADSSLEKTIVATPAAEVPQFSTDGGYVGSSSCKACHADQYASWHRSFHRTMTQRATPATVIAPFHNDRLEFQGQWYRLERDGERFYVSVDAPVEAAGGRTSPRTEAGQRRQVVMTTGSHHIQVYWALDPHNQLLIELPFYYHISSGQWILRDDTMLHPPGQPQRPSVWNDRCIKCHSVNGVPGLDPDSGTYATRVAELGIACEACHGPGANHVAIQQNAAGNDAATRPASIVNPRSLDSHAATQVCGRCHSATRPIDNEHYLESGLAYRPGDDLHEFVTLNAFDPDRARPVLQGTHELFVEDYSIDGYWGDGTCRVGGDEYNALIQSPCYERGALSCLSCHSLHQSDPDDQLAAEAQDNRACTQCHTEPRFNQQLAAHTHHTASSAGSACYNCHMPYTTYALLTAMRSHRISNPSVGDSVRFGKPNACNLCHLDRTLKWTSQHLADWYDTPEPDLNEDDGRIAASLLWLLKGNAATRIIAAWHLGWRPALESSANDWQGAFLAPLLEDPYSAVRFVADRSLRELPGFERFEYDFIAPPELRRMAADVAYDTWRTTRPRLNDVDRSTVLLDADGTPRTGEVVRLLRQRDNRPVSIAE
jgi:predicted CXXCH cytochrome family protein